MLFYPGKAPDTCQVFYVVRDWRIGRLPLRWTRMVAAEAVAVSAFQTYNFNVFFKLIQPCSAVLAKSVPAGDDWQHEIKFDGFRVQVHIIGKTVEPYSRSGGRFSPRFPRLVSVLGEFPARLAIMTVKL